MEITPVAADSMGTRSMATYVETKDYRLLLDPSVALGPLRYGLPPHPKEFQRMEAHWSKIKEYARDADGLVVSHYHYDHHNPEEPELYKGKEVYLKHPTANINKSQRTRASYFLERLGGLPRRLEFADGREFQRGGTLIRFSPAVPHGTGPRLGYVLMVSIAEGGKKMLFSSDVEGPCLREQVDFVIKEDPDVVYLDGPMSYMLGYRFSQESMDAALGNIARILRETRVERLIADHHLLRDLRWKERVKPVYDSLPESKELVTAAEYAGMENDLLEARRKEVYSLEKEETSAGRGRRR